MQPLPMRWLVTILLILAVVRAITAATTPILYAEAYYWLWSKHLAAGFHDHPPMVAVFIRLGGWLAGDGALGVRLGSVILVTLAQFAFLRFCRRVVPEAAARLATLLLALTLVSFPFGLGSTPDAPLLVFWILTLAGFERALTVGTAWRWVVAGVLAGLCILSKYTAYSMVGGLGVFLLSGAETRALLKRPWPWVALLVTALVLLPNLLWNAQHGSTTLATPFRSMDLSAAGDLLRRALSNELALVVSAMVLLTPVFFVAWLAASRQAWARWRRGELSQQTRLCLCLSWVPFGMFIGLSLLMRISTHWIAPCFLAALPLVAAWITDAHRPRIGWRRAGLVLASLTLLPLVLVPQLAAHTELLAPASSSDWRAALSANMRSDPVLHRRLTEEIDAHPGPLLLMASDYHLSAKLQWLADGHPALPLKRHHFRQLQHWYQEGAYDGWDALYVQLWEEGDDSSAERIAPAFDTVRELPPEVIRQGDVVIATWRFYLCKGFHGPVGPP